MKKKLFQIMFATSALLLGLPERQLLAKAPFEIKEAREYFDKHVKTVYLPFYTELDDKHMAQKDRIAVEVTPRWEFVTMSNPKDRNEASIRLALEGKQARRGKMYSLNPQRPIVTDVWITSSLIIQRQESGKITSLVNTFIQFAGPAPVNFNYYNTPGREFFPMQIQSTPQGEVTMSYRSTKGGNQTAIVHLRPDSLLNNTEKQDTILRLNYKLIPMAN